MQGQGQQYSTNDLLVKLNSALSLSKVMPPSKLKKNLIGLINLAPEIEDNLMEKIELPMEIDRSNPEQPFLKTQFNRQGDSYRSPFTNQYLPHYNGYRPTGHFRAMQEIGHVMFSEYIKLYYGGETVGNFYVLESGDNPKNFSCGFFAKKYCSESEEFKGYWDSFNIIDITENAGEVTYHMNSTVLIEMEMEKQGANISGFLKKQKIEKFPVNHSLSEQDQCFQHLAVIGEMVENIETIMRQHLQAIYITKTNEIISNTRYENTIVMEEHKKNLAQDLRKLKFGK